MRTVNHPLLVGIQDAWQQARPFQVEDAEFAAKCGSVVLGHKTGLGKTFIAQLAWSLWPEAQKGLIIGTLSSMATWWRLLQQWGGVEPVFLQGAQSLEVWREAVRAKTGIWMCTYSSFRYYMSKTSFKTKAHFDVLIDDELHRMMRNRSTKIYGAHLLLDFDHYIGCSATWASRGPQDLWPVLHLMNRRTFPSYWKFVNTFCFVETGTFGKEVFGVKNGDNLRKMLQQQYFRSRNWKDVSSQFGALPGDPVVRRAQRVAMSHQQHEILSQLQADMIVELGEKMIVTPNALSLLTRCLQIAISPRLLFPEADFGGPIEWLRDKVAEDPHTVIFCPFKAGLSVMEDALIKDNYPPEDIFELKGGTSPEDINSRVAAWKKCKGVMLCTIDFAQSFDLDTTDTAYMLGFDWDPNDNYQAEGRLRRLDSALKSPCLVRYIIPERSEYELVKEVVNGKLINTQQFLQGYLSAHQKMVDAPQVFEI